MRKLFDAAVILAVGGMISTHGLACGDKLILTIGNVRFSQIMGSLRPASILAYTPQNSPVAQVVKELERQPAGKRAGLTFYSLDDRARLNEVLRAQKYDLLLVDAADAATLQREAQTVPSKPMVLPVVSQSNKAAAVQAEKEFHCVLTAPNPPSRYLSAIDRAMEFKLKAPAR
ncbi:MAG TPA: hypothetical protein VMH81_12480 [Bryobacteraceae bacterium]|nr:hypothetical protein [Bryobacteraceae bacterium]